MNSPRRRTREDISADEVPFDFSKNRHLAYKTERQALEGLKGLVAHNLERLGFIG